MKHEIDDAMIRRAAKELIGMRPVGEEYNSARRILDAALNPSTKPEIIVTDEMITVGQTAWAKFGMLEHAYRAMFAARPKEKPRPGVGLTERRKNSRRNDGPCLASKKPACEHDWHGNDWSSATCAYIILQCIKCGFRKPV